MFWTFQWWEIRSFFESRNWWKILYLLITEKFLFWTFRWWAIRSFFESKNWWKMIFTDYWKVLILIFSVVENTVFFESKSWCKDHIYWLPRSSCFELFGNGKYDLFFSQKVGGKIIFTWSFWAFHDIPGLGKYRFSCSASNIFQNVFC